MRLEKASYKAIKYACLNFHYANAVPVNPLGYACFNDNNEWCGCIVFGQGATHKLGHTFNLKQGQILELTRMALNGKQQQTSRYLAIALRLAKKDFPLVSLIVSYADSEQKHIGIIYQATNWIYIGQSTDYNVIVNGERMHRRSSFSKYGTSSIGGLQGMGLNVKQIKTEPKHKYIYPLHKSMRSVCNELSKPYPKAKTSA